MVLPTGVEALTCVRNAPIEFSTLHLWERPSIRTTPTPCCCLWERVHQYVCSRVKIIPAKVSSSSGLGWSRAWGVSQVKRRSVTINI